VSTGQPDRTILALPPAIEAAGEELGRAAASIRAAHLTVGGLARGPQVFGPVACDAFDDVAAAWSAELDRLLVLLSRTASSVVAAAADYRGSDARAVPAGDVHVPLPRSGTVVWTTAS
jgi:hypothetical protein